jgi:hypothetical protein
MKLTYKKYQQLHIFGRWRSCFSEPFDKYDSVHKFKIWRNNCIRTSVRTLAIIITCFKFIAIPSILITLISAVIFWSSESRLFIIPIFWTKIITTALLVTYVYAFRSEQFYFFNNLGCSNLAVYRNMILVDAALALVSFSFVFFML